MNRLKRIAVDTFDEILNRRSGLSLRLTQLLFLTLLLGFGLVWAQVLLPDGSPHKPVVAAVLARVPLVAMVLSLLRVGLHLVLHWGRKNNERHHYPQVFESLILVFFNGCRQWLPVLSAPVAVDVLVTGLLVLMTFRNLSRLRSALLNPSLLFVLSFFALILVGTFLLLIPQATNRPITFIDALFTATSAVCVTGLSTVDSAAVFSHVGYRSLLILIQLGGLGLMTFTNFFSILLSGSLPFRNQVLMMSYLDTHVAGTVYSTLRRIFVYVFAVELLGFLLLLWLAEWPGLPSGSGGSSALFHAVSAFCNAGFSNLPGGLEHPSVQHNYAVQLVIAALILLGGLGFPVAVELYIGFQNLAQALLRKAFYGERLPFPARSLSVHSRLVLMTSCWLLAGGTLAFFLTERQGVLLAHPTALGKAVTAFFGVVTPRTAGFSTVPMGELTQATLLLYLLLMWIGASPSSTGGGIKTTTFALSLLNVVSLLRGRERIELYRREIPNIYVRRAFVFIFVSLLVIGLGVFLMSLFEPALHLNVIAFECFSAYSTVGLSVNITPLLSTPSKIVLICIMFLGRVGVFTLLVSMFNRPAGRHYRYPTENVLIN